MHQHAISTEPDSWPVAWTHTHYGRGLSTSGAEAVAGVIAAWSAAAVSAGWARLVVDEDAGWMPGDVDQEGGDWADFTSDTTVDSPLEAVRVWWAEYVGEDTPEEELAPGWAEAVAPYLAE